jgi:thiamine-phosphate pyrophosphorylase
VPNAGILRVIDANFNRLKEGLRVIEDIFRFIKNDDALRSHIRRIRHCLDKVSKEKIVKIAITKRDSRKDLGRHSDILELNRKNYSDILYINFQRVKESLRVLEEFFKVVKPQSAKLFKGLRYKIYTVEQASLLKYPLKGKNNV